MKKQMNYLQKVICLYSIFTLVGCAAVSNGPSTHVDSFEGKRQNYWSSSNRNGDATSRSGPSIEQAREGRYSYKFYVRQGDYKASTDRKNNRERQEMYLPNGVDQYNKDIWYTYSIYIPDNFPTNIGFSPVVVGQWKHDEKAGRGLSPFLSLRIGPSDNNYVTASFILKNLHNPKGGINLATEKIQKMRWHDVVVNFRNSLEREYGYVKVWIDDKKIVNYSGITGQIKSSSYFKIGIYRKSMPEDMIIYVDNFARTDNSPELIGINNIGESTDNNPSKKIMTLKETRQYFKDHNLPRKLGIYVPDENRVYQPSIKSRRALFNNISCGETTRNLSWWPLGANYAYEIMDKGKKGYKVKVWAKIENGEYIHLDCQRNIHSKEAAILWLKNNGYSISSEGTEHGGSHGFHKTVDKGTVYRIPDKFNQ